MQPWIWLYQKLYNIKILVIYQNKHQSLFFGNFLSLPKKITDFKTFVLFCPFWPFRRQIASKINFRHILLFLHSSRIHRKRTYNIQDYQNNILKNGKWTMFTVLFLGILGMFLRIFTLKVMNVTNCEPAQPKWTLDSWLAHKNT